MFKLGNLIPHSPYKDSTRFNVYEHLEEINPELPTLIIGWENVKRYYDMDRINPLNRKFDGDIHWTLDMTEDRKFYEPDKYYFLQHCYNELIKNVEYVAVDPFQFSLSSIKRIYRKLNNSSSTIGYIYKDSLYLYHDNVIFGFDIELYNRMGMRRSLSRRIKSLSKEILNENNRGLIEYYEEDLSYMNNEIKYIPYLYFKDHYEEYAREGEVGPFS